MHNLLLLVPDELWARMEKLPKQPDWDAIVRTVLEDYCFSHEDPGEAAAVALEDSAAKHDAESKALLRVARLLIRLAKERAMLRDTNWEDAFK